MAWGTNSWQMGGLDSSSWSANSWSPLVVVVEEKLMAAPQVEEVEEGGGDAMKGG